MFDKCLACFIAVDVFAFWIWHCLWKTGDSQDSNSNLAFIERIIEYFKKRNSKERSSNVTFCRYEINVGTYCLQKELIRNKYDPSKNCQVTVDDPFLN